MSATEPYRVGYVVRRYPRYSETFIVNEIIDHESSGLAIEILSLWHPTDEHFQDVLARVKAPVKYFVSEGLSAEGFWLAMEQCLEILPDFRAALGATPDEEARYVYPAMLIALHARRSGTRHLHAHFASEATTVARLAAAFSGLQYSFTAHAKDIFLESVNQEVVRRNLAGAAAVVTVSEYNLRYLRRVYGDDAGRVRRIYNGLDLGLFPFTAPEVRPPYIVAVGRLVEKKGFADLVEACALLAARGVAFEGDIIGEGLLEAELDAQIRRFGLQGRLRLAGMLPRNEVIKRLRRAAVMAAPCVVAGDNDRDGLPTVLLEAMAVGTPCVSTDVTGIPEVLRDGDTGLAVGQHDPPALAASLERLLTDSELRVWLSLRARHLIEAEFDIRRSAAELRGIFQGVGLTPKRTPAGVSS